MGDIRDDKCTGFRLTAAVAQRRVRELAVNSANLRWTEHIRERMLARGIDSEDVLRILRSGDVDDAPIPGKSADEWKVKVTRLMSNGRVAGVVTVLIRNERLRLLTAEWEDHR